MEGNAVSRERNEEMRDEESKSEYLYNGPVKCVKGNVLAFGAFCGMMPIPPLSSQLRSYLEHARTTSFWNCWYMAPPSSGLHVGIALEAYLLDSNCFDVFLCFEMAELLRFGAR